MSDLIDIERVKNMRAMRYITFTALCTAIIIALLVFLRCWYYKEVPDPLLRFTDIALPGFLLFAAQFFRTEDNKAPTKRKQGIAAKNDRKYDFHMY